MKKNLIRYKSACLYYEVRQMPIWTRALEDGSFSFLEKSLPDLFEFTELQLLLLKEKFQTELKSFIS